MVRGIKVATPRTKTRCPKCFRAIAIRKVENGYLASHPKCGVRIEGRYKKDILPHVYRFDYMATLQTSWDYRIYTIDIHPFTGEQESVEVDI